MDKSDFCDETVIRLENCGLQWHLIHRVQFNYDQAVFYAKLGLAFYVWIRDWKSGFTDGWKLSTSKKFKNAFSVIFPNEFTMLCKNKM